ncbi:unnamed protein product [Rhizophagus irregularis]|nr:unnamed protein product [Rhizophagus irregularis]
MSDILKARVAKLEQDSKQPQNDSPFEKAFNIPESVAVQLKKHTPFEENVEPEKAEGEASTRDSGESKGPGGTHDFPEYFFCEKKFQFFDDQQKQQKITHLEEGCFGTESEQNDELIPMIGIIYYRNLMFMEFIKSL